MHKNNPLQKDALKGVRLLITRPQAQAEQLAQQLQAAGGQALIYPTIEIATVNNNWQEQLTQLQNKSWAYIIVTSQYAWQAATRHCLNLRKNHFIAIGSSTAACLQQDAITNISIPNSYGSDSALQLDILQHEQIHGKNILLLTGTHPRPLLANTLKQRGAQVSTIETYQRVCPQRDWSKIVAAWQAKPPHAFTASSIHCVENLVQILDDKHADLITKMHCIAGSKRIATTCKQQAWGKRIWLAESPANNAIMDVLVMIKNKL